MKLNRANINGRTYYYVNGQRIKFGALKMFCEEFFSSEAWEDIFDKLTSSGECTLKATESTPTTTAKSFYVTA